MGSRLTGSFVLASGGLNTRPLLVILQHVRAFIALSCRLHHVRLTVNVHGQHQCVREAQVCADAVNVHRHRHCDGHVVHGHDRHWLRQHRLHNVHW